VPLEGFISVKEFGGTKSEDGRGTRLRTLLSRRSTGSVPPALGGFSSVLLEDFISAKELGDTKSGDERGTRLRTRVLVRGMGGIQDLSCTDAPLVAALGFPREKVRVRRQAARPALALGSKKSSLISQFFDWSNRQNFWEH